MQLTLDFLSSGSPARREGSHPRQPFSHVRRGAYCDRALTETARRFASHIGSVDLARKVTVWWNPRLETTAGTADYSKLRIDLNPLLKPFGERAVDRILRHELAHLVAFDRNRHREIQPHGREWKAACRQLGIPGEKASHSLPLASERSTARYAYRCVNCGQVVYRKRRMADDSACYDCCRNFNSGRYDERFSFQRVALNPADSDRVR